MLEGLEHLGQERLSWTEPGAEEAQMSPMSVTPEQRVPWG